MMKNEISLGVFSEYLMEKVDKGREWLSFEEFQEIEF